MIVIGGNRTAALKRVARYGDGWHPMNVSPEGVERRMATIREELGNSGRASLPQAVDGARENRHAGGVKP